jgi:hypothetical protein
MSLVFLIERSQIYCITYGDEDKDYEKGLPELQKIIVYIGCYTSLY